MSIQSIVSFGSFGAIVFGAGVFLSPLAHTSAIAQSKEDVLASPELIAVKFHADWCGHCRKVTAYYDDLQKEFADGEVLFVTFDVTDKTQKHQTEMLANIANLDDLWIKNEGKNGFLLLVDAKTGEVKDKLTSGDDVDSAVRKVRAAL